MGTKSLKFHACLTSPYDDYDAHSPMFLKHTNKKEI